MTLTNTITPEQSGSHGNEGVFHILQNLGLIIRCSLVSYPGNTFVGCDYISLHHTVCAFKTQLTKASEDLEPLITHLILHIYLAVQGTLSINK